MQAIEAAAKLQVDQGDIDGALTRLVALLERFPQSPGAFLAYKCYRLKGDLPGAEQLTRDIGAKGRLTPAHLRNLAAVARACGQERVARSAEDQAAGAGPHQAPRSSGDEAEGRRHPPESELADDDVLVERIRDGLRTGTIDARSVHQLMRDLAAKRKAALVDRLLVLLRESDAPGLEYAIAAAMRAWSTFGAMNRVREYYDLATELGVKNIHHEVSLATSLAVAGSYREAADVLTACADQLSALENLAYRMPVQRIARGGEEDVVRDLVVTFIEAGVPIGIDAGRDVVRRFGGARTREWFEHLDSERAGPGIDPAFFELMVDIDDPEGAADRLIAAVAGGRIEALDAAQRSVPILSAVGRSGQATRCADLLERLREGGVPMDGYHYHVAMTAAAMADDVQQVQRLLGDALEQGITRTSHLVGSVILALSRAGLPAAAEAELSRLVKTGAIPHPRHHYGPIIHAYRSTGAAEDAQRLIDDMHGRGIRPDQHNIADTMQAWAQEGLGARALQLFAKYVDGGGAPDAVQYGIAMQISAASGDADTCEELATDMSRHALRLNAHHYAHLMHANVASGRPTRARELVAEMESQEIDIDGYHAQALVMALAGSSDSEALEVIGAMVVDHQLWEGHPSLLAALVRAWQALGRTDKIDEIMNLAASTPAPDVFSQQIAVQLMRLTSPSGDLAELARYAEMVRGDDGQLPVDAAISMVVGATRAPDIPASRSFAHDLDQRLPELSDHQLEIVAGSLAAIGLVKEAEVFVGCLAERGVLSARSIGQLMDALSRKRRADDVESTFRRLIASAQLLPGEETYLYNLLLRAFLWDERAADVERVKEEMLARGLALDRFTLGTVEASRRSEGVLEDQDIRLRGVGAIAWQELAVVLDDVVHELSQEVGRLGALVNAARALDPEKDSKTIEERLAQTAGVVNTLADRLDAYSAISNRDHGAGITNVEETVEWAIARTHAEAHRMGVQIRVDSASARVGALTVQANHFFMRLAIKALIANSIDALASSAIPPGERRVWVNTLHTPGPGQGWIDVYVRDNGPGIPEAIRERIFERGFSTKEERGLGLGLSLVDSVATALGGTVSVTVNGASGAEFWLRVPANQEEGASVD